MTKKNGFTMWKRAIVVGISVLCIGSNVIPKPIYAAETNLEESFLMEGDWAYGTNYNGVYIGGYVGDEVNLVVPSEIAGEPVTEIFPEAFKDNTTLKSIVLPETVKEIGTEAFMNCSGMETIVLPADLEKIGDYAFYGAGLTSLDLPDALVDMGESAFSKCNGLVEVTIPKNVNLSYAGTYAFAECENLQKVVFADGVEDISEAMFMACENLVDVTIPDSVTVIGTMAFKVCTALSDIAIPNSVVTINEQAFYGCTGMESLIIPDSVTYIGDSAFEACSNLAEVTMPACLGVISPYAFKDCTSISAITLPDETESIGISAFEGCSNLVSMDIPASITDIYENAFLNCSDDFMIYTPDDASVVINYAISEDHAYTTFEPTEPEYYVEGDWRYRVNADSTITILRYMGEEETVLIPDTLGEEGFPVEEIGDYAFLRNEDLRKVVVPDSVIVIGDSAFNTCVAFEIYIPDNVSTISTSSFSGCESFVIYTVTDAMAVTYAKQEEIEYVVGITNIQFANETLSVTVGDYTNLEITVTPEDTTVTELEWNSSNPDVISVDSEGTIEVFTAGTVTITASYTDKFTGDVISASCEITAVNEEENDENTEDASSEEGDENTEGTTTEVPTTETPTTETPITEVPKTETPTTETPKVETPTTEMPTTEVPKTEVEVPNVSKVKKLKVTAQKKALVIKWQKMSDVKGYQIQVSTKSNFKGAKIKDIKKSKTSYTAKKLKAKKKYYVRIRAYKTYKNAEGKTEKAYGKWVKISKKTK